MSTINVDQVLPSTATTVEVNGVFIGGDDSNSSIKLTNDVNQVSGINNTVLGWGSGFYLAPASNANTLVGRQAGPNITTGSNNTAIGAGAVLLSTTGYNNTGIGAGALQFITTGYNNIAIGQDAQSPTATTNNSITLGNSSNNILRCAVTSITSLSDARDKKEIEELPVGLEFVKGLKPVKFVWNDRNESGKHDVSDFGFIAQDLKASQEEVEMAETLKLVYEENPEKLEASYGKLIPILVKAIQDLNAKVELLENK